MKPTPSPSAPPEPNPVVKLSISLRESHVALLDKLCAEEKRTRSGQFQFLLEKARRSQEATPVGQGN